MKYINQLKPESPRLLGAVCMAILIIILVAGLWPFNFFSRNTVAWLPDQNGVHFYGQGIIDVVLNSAGTILGVVIFQFFTQNPKSHRIGGKLRRLI